MYITEIAPAKNRGKLVATFQFNIVFGILIAYFSNYLLQGIGGDDSWRLMRQAQQLVNSCNNLLVSSFSCAPFSPL